MTFDPQDPIKGRNDFQPDVQIMNKASLPPNQKLAKDVWGDVFLLTLAVISLLAARWDIIPKEDFGRVLFGILILKASLSTGKGISLDALPFMRK